MTTVQCEPWFLYLLKVYLFFLTSTAFVDTKAKYGIPLSKYTVFLQNCPLGYDPKVTALLLANNPNFDTKLQNLIIPS